MDKNSWLPLYENLPIFLPFPIVYVGQFRILCFKKKNSIIYSSMPRLKQNILLLNNYKNDSFVLFSSAGPFSSLLL